MARLIVFSDYLKSIDKSHVLNTLEYMGEREGVVLNEEQLLKDLIKSRVLNESTKEYDATEAQKKLIGDMLSKYPDLKEMEEYDQYKGNRNMYNASVFIKEGLEFLQEMALNNEVYMKYISERPGVSKNTNAVHGLFDQQGAANRDLYYKELNEHHGNVYRDIISLRLEDAIELEYDNQDAWKTLLQTKMIDKAHILGIPVQDFKWCAAFHDEGFHPHVHVMCWDAKGSRGFQDRQNLNEFKSLLANEIFKEEMWLNKELKNETRKDLEAEFHQKIHDLNKDVLKGQDPNDVINLKDELMQLSRELNNYGSTYYGYQSDITKRHVNKIVSNLLYTPTLSNLFDKYLDSQASIVSMYQKDVQEYMSGFQSRILTPGKGDRSVLQNYVVRAAYEVRQNEMQRSLLLDPSLKKLDAKINVHNSGSIRLSEATVDKTLIALAKLELIRQTPINQIEDKLTVFEENEEKCLELIMLANENPDIKMNEIKLINRFFGIKLEATSMYNNVAQTYETVNLRAAGKLIQQFCNVLSTNTIQNEQEAARINMVRREDEYFIKKSQLSKK